MLNFEKFIARHGEFGVLAIIGSIERYEGIKANDNLCLEDRWNLLMRPQQKMEPEVRAIYRVTYGDLIMLYGREAAFTLLRTVERHGNIKCNVVPLDKEIRLQLALDALNDNNVNSHLMTK